MRHGTTRLPTISAILATVLLAALPAAAQAEDPEPVGDDYASGDFGRVRYHENGLTIDRADDEVQGEPGVNAPVFPGDTVITSQTQRAEIQLGNGTLVRVGRASQVTFLSMPDPYATIRDATVLQLAEGTMRIAAKLSEDEEFRIDTLAASIYLLGDGDFRLEVDAHGHTEVVSRRGVAEVVGNGGSVLVRSGLLTDVYPDSLPAEPSAFNTFISDNFDRWVDRRDAAYRARERHADYDSQEVYDSLPEEVQPYYGELAGAGDWTYADEYGYVWSPAAPARTSGRTTTAPGATGPAAISGSPTNPGVGLRTTTVAGSGSEVAAGAGRPAASSPARGSPGRSARPTSGGARWTTGTATTATTIGIPGRSSTTTTCTITTTTGAGSTRITSATACEAAPS